MKLDNNTRFIGDTHFGHSNVVKFDKSIFWSKEARDLDDKIKNTSDRTELDRLKKLERVELSKNVREQDEEIIKNWNRVVTDKDQMVIHTGDFTFYDGEDIENILNRLNGRIILIKGNHEQPIMKNPKIRDRFFMIRDYLEVFIEGQRICLFHYPVHEWNQAHRGAWMVHGHTHINDDYDTSYKRCNIGCMNWDYSPVSFQQLQIFMAAKDNKSHH